MLYADMLMARQAQMLPTDQNPTKHSGGSLNMYKALDCVNPSVLVVFACAMLPRPTRHHKGPKEPNGCWRGPACTQNIQNMVIFRYIPAPWLRIMASDMLAMWALSSKPPTLNPYSEVRLILAVSALTRGLCRDCSDYKR